MPDHPSGNRLKTHAELYRTFGGERYHQFWTDPTAAMIKELRIAGVRCRRVRLPARGIDDLMVHHGDMELAKSIWLKMPRSLVQIEPDDSKVPENEIEKTASFILKVLDTAASKVYPDEASIPLLEPHVARLNERYMELRQSLGFAEAHRVSRMEFIRDTYLALFDQVNSSRSP